MAPVNLLLVSWQPHVGSIDGVYGTSLSCLCYFTGLLSRSVNLKRILRLTIRVRLTLLKPVANDLSDSPSYQINVNES